MLMNATYSALVAHGASRLPLPGLAFTGLGYALILGIAPLAEQAMPTRPAFLLWAGTCLALAAAFMLLWPWYRRSHESQTPPAPTRAMKTYFLLHGSIVGCIGGAMYLAPVASQSAWPWKLDPNNMRFIGAVYAFTAAHSLWALLQRSAVAVAPSTVVHGVFSFAALLAMIRSHALFDLANPFTWALLAAYLWTLISGWYFAWQLYGRKAATVW